MVDKFFVFETIGVGSPYMTRLLIGRLRLHIFHRPDGDPDPHDHPWHFTTFPLTSYVEEVTRRLEDGTVDVRHETVRAFRLHRRPATYLHRVLGRALADGCGRARSSRSYGAGAESAAGGS